MKSIVELYLEPTKREPPYALIKCSRWAIKNLCPQLFHRLKSPKYSNFLYNGQALLSGRQLYRRHKIQTSEWDWTPGCY